ncbi:MAG TPA: Hsp70 family protein, partial [Herpetosiphonaceae bacterium]
MRLGIDIGTDAARAAYVNRRGEPELVRFDDGRDWMPALVRQTMHGLQVGEPAARALVGNRETTVTGCVRLMGRAAGIDRALLERLPFAVAERDGELACNLLYAEHPARELYGALLRALADAAERQTGEIVDEIVLT